jgi:hypothetical protein
MEMKTRGRRSAVIALAVVIAAVLIAGPADAADKKTTIQLMLSQNINGMPIIKVQPRDAKIWRNKPDKPKKVEWWWTENDTSYSEIFWEIRYDPSKGGGTADYFGDVDIECGKNEIKVQPDKKPDFPNAEWPYSITVYACKDGVKAQEIASVDPRIIWKD